MSEQSCSILKNIVYHHHERWDGNGYPDRIAEDQIPIEARIVSVADVFDALSSKRVYKKQWSFEESMNYLEDKAGSQFDPACVRVFVEQAQEVRHIMEKFRDRPEEVLQSAVA